MSTIVWITFKNSISLRLKLWNLKNSFCEKYIFLPEKRTHFVVLLGLRRWRWMILEDTLRNGQPRSVGFTCIRGKYRENRDFAPTSHLVSFASSNNVLRFHFPSLHFTPFQDALFILHRERPRETIWKEHVSLLFHDIWEKRFKRIFEGRARIPLQFFLFLILLNDYEWHWEMIKIYFNNN